MLGDYNVNPPVRQKYWKEQTTNEKLEVLADLLAEAHREIHNLTSRLDEFMLHTHHPTTGQLLVPPRDPPEFRRYASPPGYCREDFVLGRAPASHYQGLPTTGSSWAGEAQVEGCLPTASPEAAPATGPEKQPETMPLEDPDWPKPAANPQFHPKQ